MRRSGLALACVVAAACEPTVPVRDCTGCTYDFADTIPPDTSLVFHWPATRLPVRYYADPRAAMPALVGTGVATWNAQVLYGELRAIQVGDSNAAGESNRTVDHHELAMRAVIDSRDRVPAQGVVPLEINAVAAEEVDERLGHRG